MERLLTAKGPVSATNTPWLRSYQVKAMLRISYGTLQTLRNNGTLPAKKIGGLVYCHIQDIETAMKIDPPETGRRDLRTDRHR